MALLHFEHTSGDKATAGTGPHRNGFGARLKAAALLPFVIVLMIFRPGWFERDDG